MTRDALTPQWGQNCIPANMTPRHLGHETLVSPEPQYSQRAASALGAAAPQAGQLSEKAMGV
jgi:hypothetical protein